VTDKEIENINNRQIHTLCNHSNQIIAKFSCTEERNARTGVTSIVWGVMPTWCSKSKEIIYIHCFSKNSTWHFEMKTTSLLR